MTRERISLLWERESSETLLPLTRIRADFMFNGMMEASRFFEDLFNQANGNNKARFRPELTVVPTGAGATTMGATPSEPQPEARFRPELTVVPATQDGEPLQQSRPQVAQPTERLVPRFDRPFEKASDKDTEPH